MHLAPHDGYPSSKRKHSFQVVLLKDRFVIHNLARSPVDVRYSSLDNSMLKNHGISLVALKTYCATRTGLRLRVLVYHSP
jgi:hypothetical protein